MEFIKTLYVATNIKTGSIYMSSPNMEDAVGFMSGRDYSPDEYTINVYDLREWEEESHTIEKQIKDNEEEPPELLYVIFRIFDKHILPVGVYINLNDALTYVREFNNEDDDQYYIVSYLFGEIFTGFRRTAEMIRGKR